MHSSVEREIWHIGCALYLNAIKLSFEVAGGIQHPADTLDRVQVGVIEGVLAGDGGVAGLLVVPRPEGTDCVDLALGNGIGEGGIVAPGSVWAQLVEIDVFQNKNLWILIGLVGADNQL